MLDGKVPLWVTWSDHTRVGLPGKASFDTSCSLLWTAKPSPLWALHAAFCLFAVVFKN